MGHSPSEKLLVRAVNFQACLCLYQQDGLFQHGQHEVAGEGLRFPSASALRGQAPRPSSSLDTPANLLSSQQAQLQLVLIAEAWV